MTHNFLCATIPYMDVERYINLVGILKSSGHTQSSLARHYGWTAGNINSFMYGRHNSLNCSRAFARLSPEAAQTVSGLTGYTVEKLLEEEAA